MPDPVPKGIICMWSGSVLPSNKWAFCDGQNGTPDLRGKFVMAEDPGNSPSPGNKSDIVAHGLNATSRNPGDGGVPSVTLNRDHLPRHTHGVSNANGGSMNITLSGQHNHTTTAAKKTDQMEIYPLYDATKGYKPRILDLSRTPATASPKKHTHESSSFQGYIGDGRGQDHPKPIPANASSFNIIPPYYVLAYIMKIAD